MRYKHILLALVCTVLTLPTIGTANATADEPPVSTLAYEENQAVDVDMTTTDKDCRPDPSSLGVMGCVQAYGDVLWVLDRWEDGMGVSLTWWELRPVGGGDYRQTGRWGKCIDNRGHAVGWTSCDKDFTEGNGLGWTLQYWDDGAWQHWPVKPSGDSSVMPNGALRTLV